MSDFQFILSYPLWAKVVVVIAVIVIILVLLFGHTKPSPSEITKSVPLEPTSFPEPTSGSNASPGHASRKEKPTIPLATVTFDYCEFKDGAKGISNQAPGAQIVMKNSRISTTEIGIESTVPDTQIIMESSDITTAKKGISLAPRE